MLPGKKYGPVDFLMMAWRRRWLMLIPAVVGGYAALIVSSRIVDQYRSETLIQVVPQRVPDSYVKSTVTLKTEDRLNGVQQQVMSRTELERIITAMDLYPRERQRLPMQDVVSKMRDNINLEIVKSQHDSRDTDAFYLRFTYPDREIATQVTDRLGTLFIETNARDRSAMAESTSNFLDTQLEEARRQLEENEHKLEAFRERNSGRLPSQVDFNMQAIQNSQMQLQALVEGMARDRDRKLMLEQLYNDAQNEAPVVRASQPTTPTADGMPAGGAAGGTLQQQLAAAREALTRLQLRLTDEHPDVIKTKRLIKDLEQRVAAEPAPTPGAPTPTGLTPDQLLRRDRVQQMRADIESLDRQVQFKQAEEQRLRQQVTDYQRRLEQTPGVESESIALMRDYQNLQDAYKNLKSNSEQSHVAAELEKRQIGEQFRTLDRARPPVRPTGVQRLYINVGGVGVGFALGVLLGAFLEFRDSTYRNGADVADVLKLPVLAVVPRLVSDDERRRSRRFRLATSAMAGLMVVAAGYGFWALQLWKHLR